jgi:FkbM family methyltransferase
MRTPFIQAAIRRLTPERREKAIRLLARLCGSRVPCVVNSMAVRIDILESIQQGMFLGEYEPTQTGWLKECLTEGDCFVDLGANFGYYTSLASKIVGDAGKVFAFEPSPIAGQVIIDMIAKNEIKNIQFVQAAVGDKSGDIDIFMPLSRGTHSPSAFFSDPTFIRLRVALIDLDHFAPLNDGTPIKLIKIDVEGSEPNVIKGLRRLAQGGLVQNLFCEFNSGWLRRNSTTPTELFDAIIECGFVVHKKTELTSHLEADGLRNFELQDIWFLWNGADGVARP